MIVTRLLFAAYTQFARLDNKLTHFRLGFIFPFECRHTVPTTMDNSMGQIVPMTSLALSQSMDSVNTATNEEEVSVLYLYFVFVYAPHIFAGGWI